MGGLISQLAFPAPKAPLSLYQNELCSRKDVVFLMTRSDERIPALYIRSDSPAPFTILYSHGNAEDIALHIPFIEELAAATKCDVFSYEYVGYSLSMHAGGVPSEAGCLRSIDAAWRYVTEELKIPPSKIVLYGRSIGTGPTVDLAHRSYASDSGWFSTIPFASSPLDVAGVLLQSPIASGARAIMGTGASIVGYGVDIFRNYEKVGKITAPVAIMHGVEDEVVPCSNGRQLYESLRRPFEPYWMEGHGHNDMPLHLVLAYTVKFISAIGGCATSS